MSEKTKPLEFTAEQLQAHPELVALLGLMNLLILGLLTGCLVMWVRAIIGWVKGKRLLEVHLWQPRVWGLIDILFIGAMIVVLQTLALKSWASFSGIDLTEVKSDEDIPVSGMAIASFSYLLVLAIAVLWIVVRYRASLSHIGFAFGSQPKDSTSPAEPFRNLKIGIGATVMTLPIIFGLMALVSLGMDQEYNHPLLTQMNKEGSLLAYLMAVFAAVVAAPLCEEFLFRVLLQGWLQSIPQSLKHGWWFLGASETERQADRLHSMGASVPAISSIQGVIEATVVESPTSLNEAPVVAGHNPYDPPNVAFNTIGLSNDERVLPPLWPSFVTGILFGLAHIGYGLSFIPLILLGIILGLLYRATASIWPGLIIHFSLNSFSMLGMGLSLYSQQVLK